MKKFDKITFKSIAVLALAMAANVAVGQNLKLTSNGNPVENNSVIELPYTFDDLSIPGVMEYYYYKWDPHLEASLTAGSEELTVTVTSVDDAKEFQLCWPSGCQMVAPGGSTSSSGTIGTKPTDLQIHKEASFMDASLRPTEGGTIKVKLECGGETIEVTVNCLLTDGNSVGENISIVSAPEYYNLQGVRVAEPQKGQLVIERRGGKTVKRIF